MLATQNLVPSHALGLLAGFQTSERYPDMAVGPNRWYHFGVGAPPILEPIVGIGMFTGGTIWILTHGLFLDSF